MLYKLAKEEYVVLDSLFNGVDHNRTIIDAVVQGYYKGKVFVDSVSNPSVALVYPEGAFMYLVTANPNETLLEKVQTLLFEELKTPSVELFTFPEMGPMQLQTLLGGRPHVKLIRREYRLNPEKFAQVKHQLSLPSMSEYSLSPVDSLNIEKFPVEQMPGWTKAEFLKHSFGYILTKGSELVSQCIVAFRSSTAVELSVKTSESYRRQGMAFPVCAAVINQALCAGLIPTWSCWEFNEASWRLGEKLGFELDNKKELYLWDAWVQQRHETPGS